MSYQGLMNTVIARADELVSALKEARSPVCASVNDAFNEYQRARQELARAIAQRQIEAQKE